MNHNISTKLLEKLLECAARGGDVTKMRELISRGTPLDESIMEIVSKADPIKAGILALDMACIESRMPVSKRLNERRKQLGLI